VSKLIHAKTEAQANAIRESIKAEYERFNLDKTLQRFYNQVNKEGIDYGQLKTFELSMSDFHIDDKQSFFTSLRNMLEADGWQDVSITYTANSFSCYFKVNVRRPI
jgi:hypothetical protein